MPDVLSTIIAISGIVIGLLSGASAFFGRERYKGQIQLLQAGNDELRSQNTDLRSERSDLRADLAACQARAEERERVLQEYKDQNFSAPLAQLTTLTTNNHKEIMGMIGKLVSNGK